MSDEELEDVVSVTNSIKIGDKNYSLRYPMKSWRIINTEYGGMNGIKQAATDDAVAFCLDKLPALIFLGITDSELTLDNVVEGLDEYTFAEMREILNVFMNSLVGAVPRVSDNPTQAKPEATQ